MKRYLPWIISLGFVLSVNIYFRTFAINFPHYKEQARRIIEEQVKQSIARDVYSKFPRYDPLAKDRLIQSNFELAKKYNKNDINKQVQDVYSRIKSRYQDENGQTFIFELDCWHWARYVENVLDHGVPEDELVNGKRRDTMMFAPEGFPMAWDSFFYYLSAFLYEMFCFFKFVPLFTFLFYLPLFFEAVLAAILYCFVFRYGRHLGAAIATLAAGLAPILIPRSCAGWYDKDVLAVFFPVLIVWPYLESYNTVLPKRRTLLIFLSAFFCGLFCFTWVPWWFSFMMVVIYEALSIACHFVLYKWRRTEERMRLIRQRALSVGLLTLFTIIWIILLCGFEPLVSFYNEVTKTIVLIKPLVASIWPNVFSTVGELKKMDIKDAGNAVGGMYIFAISIICLMVISIRNLWSKKYAGFKRESSNLLVIWLLCMFYACTQGIRFAMFLPVPLGIALGWAIGDIYEYFRGRKKVIEGFLFGSLIFIALSLDMTNKASMVARSLTPLINNTWYKVMVAMKNGTPENAVINSWWDFGDWFKVIGRRRVIFDGQSQTTPRAYWMAKAILSNSEKESVGILRMLNNGGNQAFENIDGCLKNPLKSALLLESVLALDYEDAKKILAEYLPAPTLEKVLHILFDEPPPAYFVVDPSMQGKMPAISFLGNWNFSKVYIAQNFNKEEKDKILDYLIKLGKNSEEVRRFYQEAFLITDKDRDTWVSHPVQFYSAVAGGQESGGAVYFENGFIFDPKIPAIYNNAGQTPQSLFMLRGDKMAEFIYPNANTPFSILVFSTKEGYRSVFLDRSIGNSLFSRLYFLGGQGLKYFTPQISATDIDGLIGVYKIEWSGKKEVKPEDQNAGPGTNGP